MTLKENPFYVLEANITDNRGKISSLCDGKMLFDDTGICEESRNILITPQKRLVAEIHWFIDCENEEIPILLSYIADSDKHINSETDLVYNFCSLTQLNFYCAVFQEKPLSAARNIKSDILRISRLYESLNAEEIRSLLNRKRLVSEFPQIERVSDVEAVISDLRQEIKNLISARIQQLSDDKYIEIVTAISESYSSRRSKGQAVLEDIISDYQLRVTDKLEDKASYIIRVGDFIAQSADRIKLEEAINDLLDALYDWDRMAQPMQLGALTKGGKHSESEKMFYKMRNLSLSLHNKYNLSEPALQVNEAMQKVFAEMPENLEQLKEDNKKLHEIVESNKIAPELETSLNKVTDIVDRITNNNEEATVLLIRNLLTETSRINIELCKLQTEDSIELRKALCGLVRSVALHLHNEKEDTQSAIQITKSLLESFSDIDDLNSQLNEDMTTLQEIADVREKNRVLDEKFNDLKVLADSIKSSSNSYDRSGKCNQLLSKTDELDKFINQKFSGEELKKLREHLGFLVRDVAIQIYNKYNDEQNATSIITRLRNVFFTIPNLKEKLDADYNTLQSNKIGTSANTNKYNPSNNSYSNSSKKNNSGCLWRLIVFGIIGICIYFSLRDTTSSSSTKPNTSYTSTPRSTYSTSKPTTPPSVTKPSTGYIFYNKYGDNPCELDITNNFNNDIYCKFVDKSGTVVKRFYVRSNTTAKIPMPVGTYELRFASGSTWYGESQLFGSYTSYSKDPDAYTFSYGDVWTVTYYTTTNSSGGDSVKKISAADF